MPPRGPHRVKFLRELRAKRAQQALQRSLSMLMASANLQRGVSDVMIWWKLDHPRATQAEFAAVMETMGGGLPLPDGWRESIMRMAPPENRPPMSMLPPYTLQNPAGQQEPPGFWESVFGDWFRW